MRDEMDQAGRRKSQTSVIVGLETMVWGMVPDSGRSCHQRDVNASWSRISSANGVSVPAKPRSGFLPTLLETNEQAQFLIPMTLSLSAGLLVGMAASLILTPVCYAIVGDDRDRILADTRKDWSGMV